MSGLLQLSLGAAGMSAALVFLLLLKKLGRAAAGQRRLEWWGALLISASGGVLVVHGLFDLRAEGHRATARADALERLDLLVREPLASLRVRLPAGEHDPFTLRPDTCSLWLRATRRTGAQFTSRIPSSALAPAATEDGPSSVVAWADVVEFADAADKAAAAQFRRVADFRHVDRLEVAILERGESAGVMPEQFTLLVNEHERVFLFVGKKTADPPTRVDDVWSFAFQDTLPPSVRLSAWEGEPIFQADVVNYQPPGYLTLSLVLLVAGLTLIGSARPATGPTVTTVVQELQPLWVMGLALLLLQMGLALFPQQGKSLDMVLYMTLGTVFPALVLLRLLAAWGFPWPRLNMLLDVMLAALGLWAALWFTVQSFQLVALFLAVFQWGLVHAGMILTARPAEDHARPWAAVVTAALVSFAVTLLSWTAVIRFVWFFKPFPVWLQETFAAWLVAVLGLLVVVAVLLLPQPRLPGSLAVRRVVRVAADGLAVVVLGVFSLRTDRLFEADFDSYMSFAHWSAYAGPAELVREGAWLLWDVPSLYGFLSVLTLAWLPTQTVWQALFVANAACLFGGALFLFFLLRSLDTGPLNYLLSLTVTVAAVFLLPGSFDPSGPILGPHLYPQACLFRFGWCLVLLGVLLWDIRSTQTGRPLALIVGCLVWVIGALWSSESAACCTATWLPAYGYLVLRRAVEQYQRWPALGRVLIQAALWLALPFLLLGAALFLIHTIYVARLGHPPDWSMYFEGSGSYIQGMAGEPIHPLSPFGLMFTAFCGVSTAAACLLRRGAWRTLAVTAGAWGMLWACGSFYVAISQESFHKALFLTPLVCITLAVAVWLLHREGVSDRWANLLRTATVPVLTLIITATFGNVEGLRQTVTAMHARGWVRTQIEPLLPVMDDSLVAFLEAAGVKSDQPIVYVDEGFTSLLPLRPAASPTEKPTPLLRTWLPIKSTLLTCGMMSEERSRLFLARFVARCPQSGYFLVADSLTGGPILAWFDQQVELTHVATSSHTSETPIRIYRGRESAGNFRLVWYDVRGKGTSHAAATPGE